MQILEDLDTRRRASISGYIFMLKSHMISMQKHKSINKEIDVGSSPYNQRMSASYQKSLIDPTLLNALLES